MKFMILLAHGLYLVLAGFALGKAVALQAPMDDWIWILQAMIWCGVATFYVGGHE